MSSNSVMLSDFIITCVTPFMRLSRQKAHLGCNRGAMLWYCTILKSPGRPLNDPLPVHSRPTYWWLICWDNWWAMILPMMIPPMMIPLRDRTTWGYSKTLKLPLVILLGIFAYIALKCGENLYKNSKRNNHLFPWDFVLYRRKCS